MKRYLALCLVTALTASASVTSYSPPVGGAQITFAQGTRFSGMPFINPAAQLGIVASNTSQVITLSDTAANMSTALTAGTAYYLEITAGPDVTYVGDRFEVDVTNTRASANHTITITLGSATNTLATLPNSLDGYSLTVRPHVTLGQLFGTKANEKMHGSTVASAADQVVFLNPLTQGYSTYFYLRNSSGTLAQWTLIGGGSTNRDNTVIPPGIGMIVHRNDASPVTLTWKGDIRRNSFIQPLVAGLNLVAEPLPIASSPLERALTYANGVAGSTVSSSADQVLVHTGTGYQTYFLLRNSSGSLEQWTLIGGGSTNRNNTKIFSSTGAVFIRKNLADADYSIPFTLNL
jgi:hypothetical protein